MNHTHHHQNGHCNCGCCQEAPQKPSRTEHSSHPTDHTEDDCDADPHHREHHNCGADHHHKEHCDCDSGHQKATELSSVPDGKQTVFYLEHLGCAHCAAKMETQIQKIPGIRSASLSYPLKQLRITAKDPHKLLPKIQEICTSIEPEVTVTPIKNSEHRTRGIKPLFAEHKKTLLSLIMGAILFVFSEIGLHLGLPMIPVILLDAAAYIILGKEVVITAVKNIAKGHALDENFLMTIATIGAFCTRQYPEAVGVMLFYRSGEFFEELAVERSRRQIMAAADLRPEEVTRLEHGLPVTIPAEDALPGDLLLIRPGDRIPLDGVILEGQSRIDTSPITGEPVPVGAGPNDHVLSGCINTSGTLKLQVEKPLSQSMVTRILNSVENAAATKPKMDRFITRFSRVYTPIVVAAALFTALIPSLITGDVRHWVYTALTFLVISCPCALVLSVPLSFVSGIGAGSRLGILFKGGLSLEALNRIKAVVMDKTGTLTEGSFSVQEILPEKGYTKDSLLQLLAGCEQTSTHPIAASILSEAKARGIQPASASHTEELAGLGIRTVICGREVLCGNRKLLESCNIPLEGYIPGDFGTEVLLADGGHYAGSVRISDRLKPNAAAAMTSLKKRGLYTVMLTGDTQENAEEIAAQTGIEEIHARLLPEDKLNRLTDIRNRQGAVMFVGDGINDAPVLAGADVGAAMGSGADAAIEAADVVFMTSSADAIPKAFAIAQNTNRIAWQNVIFALVIKILIMILGLFGFASMWLAVFADTGVAMLCVLNAVRILYKKYNHPS